MSAIYWDERKGLFMAGDPAKMNAQQRANWRLIRALLENAYERGFQNGRAAGIDECLDIEDSVFQGKETDRKTLEMAEKKTAEQAEEPEELPDQVQSVLDMHTCWSP